MKRTALLKTSLREINQSKTRFLSILSIIFLGVLVFVGLKATGPDMLTTANRYFEKQQLPDARIVSTVGLTAKDLAAIKKIPEVAAVAPRYSVDIAFGKQNTAVKFIGYEDKASDGVAHYQLVEGHFPQKNGEVVLDELAKSRNNYRLGQTITISTTEDKNQALATHTFKVVGFAKSPEYIASSTRGTTTIGSGTLAFFALIPTKDFRLDAYPEIFVTFKNLKGLDTYSEAYTSARDRDLEKLKAALKKRPDQRLTEIKAQAQPALEKAKQEMTAGEQALQAGAEKLGASKQALQASQEQLNQAQAEYQQQMQQAQNQIAQGQAALSEGEAQLAQQKSALAQKENQLASQSTQIIEGQKTLPNLQKQQEQLTSQQQQLTARLAAYQTLASSMAALQRIDDAEFAAAVQAQTHQWQTGLAALQAPSMVIAAVNQLSADPQKTYLAVVMNALNEVIQQLTLQQNEVTGGLQQVTTAIETIQQSAASYQQGQQQIEAAHEQIEAAETQLVTQRTQLETGRQQLAQKQAQAQAKLAQAQQKLQAGQVAYQQGEQQYNQQKAANESKLAAAKKAIATKEEQLATMKAPKYHYFTRSDYPSFTEYKDNAQRIASLSTIFPLFFFLIAALVSLTTMTRMVEEKRTEIGSLKALGYRNGEIAFKFIIYAAIASLSGALLGLVVGYYLFPTIIFNAYGQMYSIPDFVTPWFLSYSIIGIAVALLCTVGAALVVLRYDLFSTPAVLLRPKTPKAGQRILLERLTPIWQRMSFTQKVTARNLFRYKQRMLMTVLGIAGCMALLIVGFGLKDSISDIGKLQFNKIWHYQAVVTFDKEPAGQQKTAYQRTVADISDLKATLPISSELMKTTNTKGSTQNVSIYVPKKPQDIQTYILLNDRKTGTVYQLADDGAIINEKLAKLYQCKVGDTISLKTSQNQTYKIKVSAIAENYAAHFVYLTPSYYEKVFKKQPLYNAEFLLFKHSLSEKREAALGKQLLAVPDVLNVSFLSSMNQSLDDMLKSLNIVIWVLILVSGSLALIVLYNLTNINISERIRELSTIKVLGFYDQEVTMYVYRENISLTLLGIIVGCFFGKILHSYILATVEVDMVMFSPNIHWFSYLYAALITMAFALLVMVIMHRKLKTIDMIEALKSNE
ncbi:FtsX-like permease family protein [Enterococcus faecalis]